MRLSKRKKILLIAATALIAIIFFIFQNYKPIHHFPGWAGPQETSRIEPPVRTPIAAYQAGSPSRMAIFVTDPDADWLSLAHGLKAIGIPFRVTDRYEEAVHHKVVYAYPTISGKRLSREAVQALARHVRTGGTLIGYEILGGGLHDFFGIDENVPLKARKLLRYDERFAAQIGLQDCVETEVPLLASEAGMPVYTFTLTSGRALAYYESGEPAIVHRTYLAGQTYAFGIDVGAFLARAYNGRFTAPRQYANAYEPAADVLLRTLKHIYRSAEPLAVTLDTVPDGKAASVLITHDVDYSRSIVNAIVYAEFERAQGVPATYFIQTKYVRDWNDDIFFNDHGTQLIGQLHAMGMEIGSHSVSHSRIFSKYPIGTGAERYPDYVPFVHSALQARNGSILGELRVSRFLLEKAVPGLAVQSFRPGHLQYPYSLPQALQATGIPFSSSITAGEALTHLPFQLNYNRENWTETATFEFPITIEDEIRRPMTARIDEAIDVLRRLTRYGGTMVVLLHPDVLDDKMQFLQMLVRDAKTRNVWFGTVGQLGRWWIARDQVAVDVTRTGDRLKVELEMPPMAAGLALQVPAGWWLHPQDDANGAARQNGDRVLVHGVSGRISLQFTPSEKVR